MSLPNIDLRQLRHVVVLARQLSFTGAAKELGLTQSALTRSIQTIEQRAQARLFDRDRGGVRLTELGRQYAKRAAELLIDASELDRMLERSVRAVAGETSFGMAPLPAHVLLPGIVVNEFRENPEVSSRVAISDPETLVRRVAAEEIEFCICARRPSLPQTLRASVIGSFPVSLLVRNGHPLLAAPQASRLDSFPLIVSSQLPDVAPSDAAAGDLLGRSPQVVVDDFAVLARITECSDAVWLSSSFAARDELARGSLAELPAPADHRLGQINMVMYSHRRRSLSPIALRLEKLFRKAIRDLKPEPKTQSCRPVPAGA